MAFRYRPLSTARPFLHHSSLVGVPRSEVPSRHFRNRIREFSKDPVLALLLDAINYGS